MLVIVVVAALLAWGIPTVWAREGVVPVGSPRPPVQALPAGGSSSLVVMTYNIHRGRGMDGQLDLERTYAVIQASGAGLVGLQEVDRRVLRTGLVDQLAALASKGSWEYAYGANRFLPPGTYGNALLSTYPILEATKHNLPSRREPRGLLRSVVQLDTGALVAVYVTHLGLNQPEREAHVARILAALAEEELPVVLMGDFNAAEDSPELRALGGVLMDVGASTGQPTFPAVDPQYRIDYVMVSHHFQVEDVTVIYTLASDHRPVVVTLRLEHGAA